MRQPLWKTLACSLGYLGIALACLIQWNGSNPWLRVDVFAGSYLALRLAGSLHSIVSSLRAFRSKAVREEWWALDSDPVGPKWVMALMATDLAAFLDYGHWRLMPSLQRPLLQSFGLGLYVAVAIWQTWTDAHLARYFNQDQPEAMPMDHGPYRYVRHPRYAAAIVGKIAFALVLASGLGWLLAACWGVLLLRKMAVEEAHLQSLFGRKYKEYAQRTARVVPGVY